MQKRQRKNIAFISALLLLSFLNYFTITIYKEFYLPRTNYTIMKMELNVDANTSDLENMAIVDRSNKVEDELGAP